MNVTLILILGGLATGCATAGAIGLYMVLSRSYRKARNRLAIHFGQVFAVVTTLTSFVSLQKLEQSFSVVRHSSAYYSAMYAHVLGLLCGAFFVLRAEFLWRRASGLVTSAKNNGPVIPGARRRLLIAFGIMALSSSASVAYWVFRPKPISVIFGGISFLFFFAAMIFLGRTLDSAQMRESRTIIFVVAAAMFCMFGGLAWKFHKTDPVLSTAWLATLVVPCLAALAAFFFMRSSAYTGPDS